MKHHVGMKFSTKDRDNDINHESCANNYRSCWWFKTCHACDLNGYYFKGGPLSKQDEASGINWWYFKGHYYSLKFSEMKIRPYK